MEKVGLIEIFESNCLTTLVFYVIYPHIAIYKM